MNAPAAPGGPDVGAPRPPVDPIAVAVGLIENAREQLRDDEYRAVYEMVAIAREPARQVMDYLHRTHNAEREARDAVRKAEQETREAARRVQLAEGRAEHAEKTIAEAVRAREQAADRRAEQAEREAPENARRAYEEKLAEDELIARSGVINCAVCCFLCCLPIPFLQRGGDRCIYVANCSLLGSIPCCQNVANNKGRAFDRNKWDCWAYCFPSPYHWCDEFDPAPRFDIRSAVCWPCVDCDC